MFGEKDLVMQHCVAKWFKGKELKKIFMYLSWSTVLDC